MRATDIHSGLSQVELKDLMTYFPETGIFIWNIRPRSMFQTDRSYNTWNRRFAGKEAGHTVTNGYTTIGLKGRLYRAHRLAHLYMTGVWPDDEIDHINHDKKDNSWLNLKPATRTENNRNASKRVDNKSGTTGVHWHSRNERWTASISDGIKIIHLGSFDSKSEAEKVRSEVEAAIGYHRNHGGSQ